LNEAAYRQLQVEKALRIIPGASHLFEEPGALENAAQLASEWFAQHLRQKESV
jgi:putative phosphoribosyl transferase